ncbi:MAG: hypothetical protein AAFY71_00165 [Bacteroidota bacterium]
MFKSLRAVLLFLLLGSFSYAQGDLFDDSTALHVSIIAHWNEVLADRGDSSVFHKAKINYCENGQTKLFRANIRSRGHFRRNPQVCDFPPLKVKIKKEERQGTLFKEHKNLKLVCHCKEDAAVLKEYLVYKTYEMLTPYAFQVRLAIITYLDYNNELPPVKHYAFFIEDDKHMAKRLGGKRFQEPIASVDTVNQEQLALIHGFMYMIGNMDWNVKIRKNIKTISLPHERNLIPVPYDFDWCGAVNASYVPLPKTFDRRDMKGLCRTEEEWESLASTFLDKVVAIKKLYKGFGRLSYEDRTYMMQYYRVFLRLLDKKERIQKHFITPCSSDESLSSGK